MPGRHNGWGSTWRVVSSKAREGGRGGPSPLRGVSPQGAGRNPPVGWLMASRERWRSTGSESCGVRLGTSYKYNSLYTQNSRIVSYYFRSYCVKSAWVHQGWHGRLQQRGAQRTRNAHAMPMQAAVVRQSPWPETAAFAHRHEIAHTIICMALQGAHASVGTGSSELIRMPFQIRGCLSGQ